MEQVLTGDCAKNVFAYLTPLDLLVCEKVCKLWKNVVDVEWKRVTRLDHLTFNNGKETISYDLLVDILDHCKIYITEIDFSKWNGNTECIKAIADHCPNIEVLTFSQMESEEEVVCHFATKIKKLKKLYIEKLNHIKETTYSALFAANPNLNIVHFSKSETLTGRCLTHLPKTLKELHLSTLTLLQTKYVIYCMGNSDAIEKLSLNDCLGWIDECLGALGQAAPGLKQFSLSCTIMPLDAIDKFVNLQRLYLFFNNVNDESLKALCGACIHLEALGFGGSWFTKHKNITKTGLSHISKLKKLVELNIRDLNVIDNDSIPDIVRNGKLQTFRLMECEKFDDVTALIVLENCPDLSCFDINNCSITPDTAKNVVDYLETKSDRTDKFKLKIDSRKFDLKNFKDYKHNLLEISKSNDMKFQYFV